MNAYNTYDDMYKCFMVNCKVDGSTLPTEQEKIYDMIENAVMYYNNKRKTEIGWSRDTETIDTFLDNNELLIMAHCIKLIYLENELNYFVSVWDTFQVEVGRKGYNYQVKAKERLIEKQEEKIDELIINTMDDWEV